MSCQKTRISCSGNLATLHCCRTRAKKTVKHHRGALTNHSPAVVLFVVVKTGVDKIRNWTNFWLRCDPLFILLGPCTDAPGGLARRYQNVEGPGMIHGIACRTSSPTGYAVSDLDHAWLSCEEGFPVPTTLPNWPTTWNTFPNLAGARLLQQLYYSDRLQHTAFIYCRISFVQVVLFSVGAVPWFFSVQVGVL